MNGQGVPDMSSSDESASGTLVPSAGSCSSHVRHSLCHPVSVMGVSVGLTLRIRSLQLLVIGVTIPASS